MSVLCRRAKSFCWSGKNPTKKKLFPIVSQSFPFSAHNWLSPTDTKIPKSRRFQSPLTSKKSSTRKLNECNKDVSSHTRAMQNTLVCKNVCNGVWKYYCRDEVITKSVVVGHKALIFSWSSSHLWLEKD